MLLKTIFVGILVCTLCVSHLSTKLVGQETEFTYQGELRVNGSPANGLFNMDFSLWDANIVGNQIDSTVVQNGVEVVDGKFTLQLDFGADAFDNSGRWLEITVNGFTLDPRTKITRSPYSIQTRGIFVDEDLNVGIGTTAPLAQLHIAGNNASLRLEDTSALGGFTLIEDPQPSQMRFSKSNPGGQVLFDLNPQPTDGVSNGLVRFFRQTDTSGIKRVQFMRGDLTTQTSASIGVDGEDSYFQIHGGNVGIGTSTPDAKLDVNGTANFSNLVGVGNPALFVGQLSIADSNSGAFVGIDSQWNDNTFPAILANNAGLGAAIWAQGNSDSEPEGGGLVIVGTESGQNISIDRNEIMARNNGVTSPLYLNADGGEIYMGTQGTHPALAYGRCESDGTLVSGSPNVLSVTRVSTGWYRIVLQEGYSSNNIIIVGGPGGARYDLGYYHVSTTDRDGIADQPFSFVIYSP